MLKNLSLCLLMLVSFQGLAQQIPLNPKVKMGKLANGLTYYIEKNTKPEKRVELRLAINAGSLLETEAQQGLAHFVEHMCFNGTKKFPKNELVSYLQSLGIRFGGDLNAYTSFDETVYMLPVPTDKPELVNTGLEVLKEWAFNVTFDEKEIDKERGVVLEEWRLGRGASQRMSDKQFPILLKGSQYAKRLPIGKEDILRNFKYQTLKDFYKDWYRPNLMAVIVVGDIDVNEIEQKIKTLFSDAKNPANEKKRSDFMIPEHKETIISIVSDKEATNTSIELLYKKKPKTAKTEADLLEQLKLEVFSGMLNSRLDELGLQAKPPFTYAYAGYGNYVRKADSFGFYASTSETGIQEGLRAMLTEAKRLEKHGFVGQELELYKKKYMTELEQRYNNRDKTESGNIVWDYVGNFLSQVPATGITYQYDFSKKNLDKITIAELNTYIKSMITKENFVVAVQVPEKENLKKPTEQEIKAILAEIETIEVKPYESKKVTESIIEGVKIKEGKITSEKKIAKIDVTELVLSNGVKVILKPTEFKNDEILVSAYSPGGLSLVSDADFVSGQYISNVVAESGINNLSQLDMTKTMSGKNVNISPNISSLFEGFNGSTTPKDLETALQLIHLYFVAPRKDEVAFASSVSKQKAQMANISASPQFYFLIEFAKFTGNNSPRAQPIPDMDKVNYEKGLAIYKDRFADASDFTFIFTGNIKIDEIKPLLEKYLGSLPAINRKETWKDNGLRTPKGMIEKTFLKGTDPKSLVQLLFSGEDKIYDAKNNFLLGIVGDLLTIKLIEKVREEASGAYTISANGNLQKYPVSLYRFSVNFPCDPKRVDELTNIVLAEIEKIQNGNIDPKDIEKVKEARKRTGEVSIKTNRYWSNALRNAYSSNNNPEEIIEWQTPLNEWVTKENLQSTAKKYLNLKEYIKAVLKPENK